MSEAKHTPGKWLRDGDIVYALTENEQHNRFWATVQSVKRAHEGEASAEECEANARLMAAAPDLLRELAELVSLIAAEYPKQADVWLEGARAAIAAARGES